jgi:hypothetical protein
MDRLQLEIASVLDVASLGKHLEYGGPKPLAGRLIPLQHFGITLRQPSRYSSNSLFDNAVLNSRYCSPTTIPRKSPSSGLCFTAAAKTAWVATPPLPSRTSFHRSGPIVSSRPRINLVSRLAVAGLWAWRTFRFTMSSI